MIQRRVTYALLIISVFVLIAGIISYAVFNRITQQFNTIVNEQSPALIALGQINGASATMINEAVSVALVQYAASEGATDDLDKDEAEEFEEAHENFLNWYGQFKNSVEDEISTEYVDQIGTVGAELYSSGQRLIELVEANAPLTDVLEAKEGLEESEGSLRELLDSAVAVELNELQELRTSAESRTQIAEIVLLGLTGTALVFAYFAGRVLSRVIVQPMLRLEADAKAISGGNYQIRTETNLPGELHTLAVSFNLMIDAVQKRDEELSAFNRDLETMVDQRTQELKAAVQEAREATRLKDEFLAVMSHELRTPLNAIIGFQGILMMTAVLEDKSRRMVERTRANAERLLNLINDILDISRIEAGRMEIEPEPVRTSALIEKISGPMSILADEKNLKFGIQVDDNMPDTIIVDEDAITKIITNLLSNAFKFTEKGQVNLNLSRTPEHWFVSVSDTGIGIPAHMQNIIFEQFRQVDGSTKRKYGGSGLGLAIVQRLCSVMNGTVHVSSKPGQGSTFTVTLPLQATEEVA